MLAAAAIALAAAITVRVADAGSSAFGDWNTYVNAWLRLTHGQPVYSSVQLSGPYELRDTVLTGYSYPPASLILFAPFASYPAGLLLFTALNLGILLAGLWAVVSQAWPAQRIWAFAIVLALLAAFDPFVEGVGDGNVSIAIAGLFAFAWVGGPRVAAIGGGIVVMTKVPAATLFAFAARGGWRPLVPGIVIVAALVIATLPIVGVGTWLDYGRAMSNAVPSCYPANDSIACAFPDHLLGFRLGVALGIALTVGAIVVPSRLLAFSFVTAAYLAATPDLHPHVWTAAFVLAVVGATQIPRLVPNRRGRTARNV